MTEEVPAFEAMGVMICEKDGWVQAVLLTEEGAEVVCDLVPETGLWMARLMRQKGGDHYPVSGLVDIPAVVDEMMGREVTR